MAKAAATKNVPAKVEKNLPAEAFDYGSDAGLGFGNQTQEDYTIPFYTVLQKMSPQLDTVKGAKAGMIINTATGELYDKLPFVPVVTQHVFVEWLPRKESNGGNGFVGIHQLDSQVVKDAKAKFKMGEYKNGKNELIETFYVYGLAVPGDNIDRGVLAFKSTGIKKYKGWMTRARAIQIKLADGRRINPPLFAHSYLLDVAKESNSEGDFYNFQVGYTGEDAEHSRIPTSDPIYEIGRSMLEMINSGLAKADHAQQGGGGTDSGDKGGKAPF